MKHNFKLNDRVFDIRYGWVIVTELESLNPVGIIELKTEKENGKYHPLTYDYIEDDLRFLSFVEYPLEGVVQERLKEKFNVGDIGYFFDDNYNEQQRPVIYGKLTGYDKNLYIERGDVSWDNFSLTPPDLNY